MGKKERQGKKQDEHQIRNQTKNENQNTGRKQIGRGHFSIVYLEIDQINNRKIALKFIAQQKLHEYNYQREYQILTKLNHQSIIKCYGKQRNQDGLILKMEYCAGKSLRQLIIQSYKIKQPLNRSLVINILKQLLKALKHMKQNQIVHRDLKPENILLLQQTTPFSVNCVIKIADFGLSRALQPNVKYTLGLGTLGYMSPQIYQQKYCDTKYDTKSDIWSLGIIMFELLTNISLLGSGYNFEKNLQLLKKSSLQKYCKQKEIDWTPIGENWFQFIKDILIYQKDLRLDIDDVIKFYQDRYKTAFQAELPPIQSQLQTKRQSQIKTQQQIQSPINKSNQQINRPKKKKKIICRIKRIKRGPNLTEEHSNKQRILYINRK